jgi:hypothetical protein
MTQPTAIKIRPKQGGARSRISISGQGFFLQYFPQRGAESDGRRKG